MKVGGGDATGKQREMHVGRMPYHVSDKLTHPAHWKQAILWNINSWNHLILTFFSILNQTHQDLTHKVGDETSKPFEKAKTGTDAQKREREWLRESFLWCFEVVFQKDLFKRLPYESTIKIGGHKWFNQSLGNTNRANQCIEFQFAQHFFFF